MHVERDANRAKFWLTPVRLARSGGFAAAELLRLERQVNEQQWLRLGAWNEYFHRDLKPGNIMVTRSGPKLLDFGLAKTTRAGIASGLSMLPTTPPGLTVEGAILGTFQYMAPGQLEGQEADARTDIFAFGAVLYEMLAGRKAFTGKTHASLMVPS